jgi:peroxiredoxin (alkyl hydroperoxide reductase subunit C)
LRIGDTMPDFSARSTHGMVNLADYRGRWLLFFSHPADFTPVCTSEFIALSNASHRFAALNCALLGYSVDSLFSHLAWVRAIRDDLGVSVPFPILEDPTLEIARAFGMVGGDAGDAAAVRAIYIVNPRGVVMVTATYPAAVGRSVEEILRTLAALQRADDGKALAPEGWQPGDAMLLPPDLTTDRVLAQEGGGPWFYRKAGRA